ncbi:unnamed protein product [Peronospora belbahrii]|uniref:Coatomer WD associated region domain-containing protein n=1 Tax=Peronospora belbahrii TaxID=622444 RepID=A0AAU9KPS7_9STRA|nr:unnamed protein product [Peronospora belbahrii]
MKLNYGVERSWLLATLPSANTLAIGYDKGTIVLKLGHDTPVMGFQDGKKLPLVSRDLGSCEAYPQKGRHNSNVRYVLFCGDGEYIIYTAQQFRNKAFGTALDFSWSPTGTGDYVIRESISKLILFRNFKEVKSEKPCVLCAEGLFGGPGAIGSRRACLRVKFFVLRINKEVAAQSFAAGTNSPDEGVVGAFDLLHVISEKVGTGTWVGDYFLYTNAVGRLNYYVGDYQTAVVRRDFESANDILPKIPADQMDYVARFLKSQGSEKRLWL